VIVGTISELWNSTGLSNFSLGQLVMIAVGLTLIYLAIKKEYEPLLLLPIGFGGILANIPVAAIAADPHSIEALIREALAVKPGEFEACLSAGLAKLSYGPSTISGIIEGARELTDRADLAHYLHENIKPGFLGIIYGAGIANGLFPLLIFMGVGAMTDFGPLLADPKTALLGAAAQFGIFATLLGALALSQIVPGIAFSIPDAAAIGIIGGADGPTSIYGSSKLAPDLLGAIAVAAYSYMALVPIIQPPIMRLFTTERERAIEMKQLRHVPRIEKIVFPLIVLGMCLLLIPDATPLIGALMLGNLLKESGVVERLSNAAQHELINIVTILLGLSVGSKLASEKFLNLETLGIMALGLVAFSIATASGLILAKIMNKVSKEQVNPLIGAAGVSAVPMAARVANRVGVEANPHNFLLMHAMGPNVAGVIGSAVAAGLLIALCQ
jgi:oxaloacetate decarboxylase beta subunit